MSASPGRSPMRKGKGGMSPYGKGSPAASLEATAPTKRRDASPTGKREWAAMSLPEIPGTNMEGPASGPLTPKDVDEETGKEREAFEFWLSGAEGGDVNAQNSVAVCYYHGRGCEKNVKKAIQWWTRAADADHTEAMYNLGVCLYHGRGVEKDHTFAVSMFGKAAEANHPEATHLLGVCFQQGHGVSKDRDKALELFRRGAALGVEDSNTKVQVLEDRTIREGEISQLGRRIENIKDGFIQLQLERAATEEVTHAYKGAGFFLSNVKSETPIRARIDQAKKAELEIKALRQEVVAREKERKDLLSGQADQSAEIERLTDMVRALNKECDEQKVEIAVLQRAKEDLEAEGQRQREHIKELNSENTELRTVAEWAKNQRVDVLKQSLAAVVKTTMKEANEREKKLRHEIEQLRLRQGRHAGGVNSEMDAGDHATLFLKQTRRDVFLQEALLRNVIEGVRDDEFVERVYTVKSMNDEAEALEKVVFVCVEKLLDHIDTGSALSDEQSLALRESLNRIQNSMSTTLAEAKEAYSYNHVRSKRLMQENNQLRDEVETMAAKVEELRAINEQHRNNITAVEDNKAAIEEAMWRMQRQTDLMQKQAKEQEERLAKQVKSGNVDPRVLQDVKRIYGELQSMRNELQGTAWAREDMDASIEASHDRFEAFDRLENEIMHTIDQMQSRAGVDDDEEAASYARAAAKARSRGSTAARSSRGRASVSPERSGSQEPRGRTPQRGSVPPPVGGGRGGLPQSSSLSPSRMAKTGLTADSLQKIKSMHDELAERFESIIGGRGRGGAAASASTWSTLAGTCRRSSPTSASPTEARPP